MATNCSWNCFMEESCYTDVGIPHNRIPVFLWNRKILRVRENSVNFNVHGHINSHFPQYYCMRLVFILQFTSKDSTMDFIFKKLSNQELVVFFPWNTKLRHSKCLGDLTLWMSYHWRFPMAASIYFKLRQPKKAERGIQELTEGSWKHYLLVN